MIVGIYADFPQSGKTTAKDVFVKKGFTELSVATTVKESLEVVLYALGISPKDIMEYLYGSRKNEIIPQLNCTAGYLMSNYAMFMREKFTPDIWLITLQNRVKPSGLYVVDDMRFPNEFRYIVDNGLTVRVVRDSVNKQHGRAENSEGQLYLEQFDYVVSNDATKECFEEKIEKIANEILLEYKGFYNE